MAGAMLFIAVFWARGIGLVMTPVRQRIDNRWLYKRIRLISCASQPGSSNLRCSYLLKRSSGRSVYRYILTACRRLVAGEGKRRKVRV
jgi:hypothetical protein